MVFEKGPGFNFFHTRYTYVRKYDSNVKNILDYGEQLGKRT